MGDAATYESKILKAIRELPEEKIEEVVDYVEFLRWKVKISSKDDFPKRFNALWEKTKIAAERARFGPKDVDRLIKEVRAKNV